jgi:hypothetical protein
MEAQRSFSFNLHILHCDESQMHVVNSSARPATHINHSRIRECDGRSDLWTCAVWTRTYILQWITLVC